MTDGPSQLERYTRLSESQQVIYSRPASGQGAGGARQQPQAPEEEYELNKKAVGICAGILLALIFLLVWLLFRTGGDGKSRWSRGGSSLAGDLLNFSALNNFPDFQTKKEFIETQLNNRLAEFNGSTLEVFEPAEAKYWTNTKANITLFKDLFTAFVAKYNELVTLSEDEKKYYEAIQRVSDRYKELETAIRAEKDKIIGLLAREDELARAQKEIEDEIRALQGKQNLTTAQLIEAQKKLKEEIPNAEEAEKKLQDIGCDKLQKKMRDHLDELTKVESGIEEARAKLSTLQAEQELVQRQLEHLEALIAAKKKDRNISELDLTTARKIADLAKDIEKLEAEKANKIRDKMMEILRVLKEKFELLKGVGRLSEERRLREIEFFKSTTITLKNQVKLLIRSKQLIAEEKLLAALGRSIPGSPKEFQNEIYRIDKEIKALEKNLTEHRRKLQAEERKLKNQNETINKKHTEKEKVAQTVEQDNSTVAKCLADSESYLKEIEDYTSRRKQLVTPVEVELEQVNRALKDRSELVTTQKTALDTTQKSLTDTQKQMNSVLKGLKVSYDTLHHEKDIYKEKRARLDSVYKDLEFYKTQLIDFLTHVNEPPKEEEHHHTEEVPAQAGEQAAQADEQPQVVAEPVV